MKKLICLSSLVLVGIFLVGCGSSSDTAPTDDAFQKGLADAQAKNPNQAPPTKGRMNNLKAPSGKGGAPAGTAGTAGN